MGSGEYGKVGWVHTRYSTGFAQRQGVCVCVRV